MKVFCSVLFFQRCAAKLFGHFSRLRALFRLEDQRFKRLPFLFGVIIAQSDGRVILRKYFQDSAVAAPDHVAGGKMQKRSMIAFTQEIQ